MSSVTDINQQQGNKGRWTPDEAMARFHERRKIENEKRKARKLKSQGQPITPEQDALFRSVKIGRPPKYRQEHCETIIELSKQGLSLTAIAGKLTVTKDQFYVWAQKYPSFNSALKIAKSVRTLALEESMLAEDSGPRINARIFALKNAAPEEWSDRQNIEINQTVNIAVFHANALDALSSVGNPLVGDSKVIDNNDLVKIAQISRDASLDDLIDLAATETPEKAAE